MTAAATTVAANRAVTNVNADRRGGTATSVAVGPKNAASSAAGDLPQSLPKHLYVASLHHLCSGTCFLRRELQKETMCK